MLRFDDQERTLELGVHDLVDAGPSRGDLSMQVAWSARARMRAGQVIHSRYQAARSAEDADFKAEVTVRHRLVVRGWEVTISGRVDGLTVEGDHEVVEEVKSTTLPGDRLLGRVLADFPNWALQVRLYLHFLGAAGRTAMGRLVLISVLDGAQRVLHVPDDPLLGEFIEAQLDWILHQREDRLAWAARRRQAPVPFAHDDFRPGQEALAAEAAETLAAGKVMLISAPTGYGKTAAALYAALGEAARSGRRVFFATARTTQQRMAEDAARAMAARGMPVRAISLRARDKVCQNDVVVCRPDCCPYAESYHEKVREAPAVDRLWRAPDDDGVVGVATVDAVVSVGVQLRACPFALSLDLAGNADLVIGDLNYAFDPSVRLAIIADQPGDWIVIVDEAHHLPERALGYGSPEVSLLAADTAADELRALGPAWAPFAEVAEDVGEWLRAGLARVSPGARDGEEAWPLDEGMEQREVRAFAERFEGLAIEHALLRAKSGAISGDGDPWLDLARATLRLRAALDRAGDETVVLWRKGWQPRGRQRSRPGAGQVSLIGADPVRVGPETGVKLLCRDPSGLLGPAFASFAGALCMSATLEPADFYVAMYGLPADRAVRRAEPSPFPPENQRVLVLPDVSTEYRKRDQDRAATAALIGEAVRAVPGNVAVYFPSFAFLEAVAPLLELGDRPVLVQQRGMREDARTDLLETLARAEGHALLAVLGGIFSEGVDLPGDALLAAVVVGPALPQANLERRLLQQWYQEKYDQGFRYAWLVPGMSRVVQAAGRVIRTPEDIGAVVLVGRRFLLRDYQSMFPADWSPVRSRSPADDLRDLWPSKIGPDVDADDPGRVGV